MPPLSDEVIEGLRETMHERVVAANPFDYQMFTWDDEEQMADDFTAFLSEDFDVALCVLDYPRDDLCDQSTWGGAERGFLRAVQETDTKGAVLSTFSDTISESVAARLMEDGVTTLGGIDAGLAGIQAAVDVGAAWNRPPFPPLLKNLGQSEQAALAGEELGYPIVVKALGVAHKTEAGAVRLNLRRADEVSAAVREMSSLSESYLIEKMVEGAVAELIVGVVRDDQFGPYLLVGGGGVLVELMKDSESLLLPTTKDQVLHALGQLKSAPLFSGFRGAPPADLDAAVDVILAVASLVEDDPTYIVELDINPLMLLAEGQGVVAADALISHSME
jgi:acetyl-CoA synthetase